MCCHYPYYLKHPIINNILYPASKVTSFQLAERLYLQSLITLTYIDLLIRVLYIVILKKHFFNGVVLLLSTNNSPLPFVITLLKLENKNVLPTDFAIFHLVSRLSLFGHLHTISLKKEDYQLLVYSPLFVLSVWNLENTFLSH